MNLHKIINLLIYLLPSLSVAGTSLCNNYQSDFFGPNVCVFDAKSAANDVQGIVTAIHENEKNNQFGSNGYALLFQPGNYSSVSVPVGYYTQVLGLGLTPDKTILKTISVDTDDLHDGTSLVNFWRGAENLKMTGDVVWAVSQASPLRNVFIPGTLTLALNGHYASGGFLANSEIDTKIENNGQQQWFTRNTTIGTWGNPYGVWNMVFVGDKGTPAGILPNTVVSDTPRIQEKPYLIYDQASQQYQVVVPDLKNINSVGQDWGNRNTIIPQAQFIIVKPGMTADQINAALNNPKIQSPKALIFTPGQYSLDKTIEISQPNTVVLGLGVPVLTGTTPHIPIMTTSASGIKLGGLLFEAGSNLPLNADDPSLLQIGTDRDTGSANAPTTLSDIYCRVGGRIPAQTNSCLTINDSFVIGDNLWLWRADHGAGAHDWNSDQSNHGLIVKGNNVTLYGLAVEHFQQEQVLWLGEKGSTYFYQSELPYDLDLKLPTELVSASFVIGDNVHYFNGYGFGIYDYFRTATRPYAISAIKTPNQPTISFIHMVSTKLGNSIGDATLHIQHMVQTTNGKVYGPSSAYGYAKYEAWPEVEAHPNPHPLPFSQ